MPTHYTFKDMRAQNSKLTINRLSHINARDFDELSNCKMYDFMTFTYFYLHFVENQASNYPNKIVGACSPPWWKNLRKKPPHAPPRTVGISADVSHVPTREGAWLTFPTSASTTRLACNRSTSLGPCFSHPTPARVVFKPFLCLSALCFRFSSLFFEALHL